MLNKNKPIKGHIIALITIIIWGTTFISTKILLIDFTPTEILFYRFILGFIAITIYSRGLLKWTNIKREMIFALAGLCGVTLYFLFENIALSYTLASNVSIIVSIAPFFTAIFSYFFMGREGLKVNFFIGFFIAMAGIVMINISGRALLSVNPIGDMLAILSAVVWAIYSILIKKTVSFGYKTTQVTQRVFLYGLIIMVPALFLFPFKFDLSRFSDPVNLFNMLFLGLCASAICFITWNTAIKILGAVKTSMYIYLGPTITVITAVIVLSEPVTWITISGMILTIVGLLISEKKEWRTISKKLP